MLSEEQLEEYRRMTPGERLALSREMLDYQWQYLLRGTPDHVDRKFALLERENDLRNENILAALKRAEQHK